MTAATLEKSEALVSETTLDQLVDILRTHLVVRTPSLDERLQVAAMSAIRIGRPTICHYGSSSSKGSHAPEESPSAHHAIAAE